jgi:hypothetical protein
MVPVEVDELLSESNLVRIAEDVQRRVGSAGSIELLAAHQATLSLWLPRMQRGGQ